MTNQNFPSSGQQPNQPYPSQGNQSGNPQPYGQNPYTPGAGSNFPPPPQPPHPGFAAPPQAPIGATDPNDLSLPLYGATPMQALKRFFRNALNFHGRASLSEYWWAFLITTASVMIAMLLTFIPLIMLFAKDIAASGESDPDPSAMTPLFIAHFAFTVLCLVLLIPTISSAVRRLHDANYSGWLYLLSFVFLPILIYFLVQPSVPAAAATYDQPANPTGGFNPNAQHGGYQGNVPPYTPGQPT